MNTDALTNVKKNHMSLTIYAPSQNKEYHQKYCSARSHAKFAASELIKKFEMNLAIEIKEQPRKISNNVNNRSKNKVSVSDLITEKGMIASTDHEIAFVLCTYF